MPPAPEIRRAAAALPPNPTPEDLLAIAELIGQVALAAAAARARARAALGNQAPRIAPGRAVTQLVRHHLQDLAEDVREHVRGAALAVIRRDVPAVAPAGEGMSPGLSPRPEYDLREAAARLRRTVRELLAMLKWPQWRRAFGWPRCLDGDKDWLFRATAIDDPESVAGAGRLEPPHHLPGWCLRVGEVADLDVFPDPL